MLERKERVNFYGHILDVYGTIEHPLFLAVDVAKIIDYSIGKTHTMLETVDSWDKLTETIFRSGQNRKVWVLTENGLYEVLMQSRKPVAKEFKEFVKAKLHELRMKDFTTFSEWADYTRGYEDFEALNCLREDMNLPPFTWDEYCKHTEEMEG